MSLAAIQWAFEQRCPSPITKMVLLALAHRTNGTAVCWPSFAAIATDCCLDRKNVPRYLRQLVDAKLITINRRSIGAGALANEYVLPVTTPCPHTEDTLCPHHEDNLSSHRGQGVSSQRHTNQEVREEEGSVASLRPAAQPPAPPPDPVKEIFDRGLAILGAGRRSLLGKMRQQHGDEAVLQAIVACEAEQPSEPAAFFLGCLQRAPPRNGHAKDSPVTTLYKGAYRAAQAWNKRHGIGDSGISEPAAFPLLDSSRR
jgi:hypothetical protein